MEQRSPQGGRPKLDRRVARTRYAIKDAFERLVVERGLDKVTVSAIAAEADIDRKTFYAHFGSVEGLLESIANDMVSQVLDEVDSALMPLADKDVPEEERLSVGLREFFSAINRSVCDNYLLSRKIAEGVPADKLLPKVLRPLERELAARGYLEDLGETMTHDQFEYLLSFELAGMLAVYRDMVVKAEAASLDVIPDADEVNALVGALVERGLVGLEAALGK